MTATACRFCHRPFTVTPYALAVLGRPPAECNACALEILDTAPGFDPLADFDEKIADALAAVAEARARLDFLTARREILAAEVAADDLRVTVANLEAPQ